MVKFIFFENFGKKMILFILHDEFVSQTSCNQIQSLIDQHKGAILGLNTIKIEKSLRNSLELEEFISIN